MQGLQLSAPPDLLPAAEAPPGPHCQLAGHHAAVAAVAPVITAAVAAYRQEAAAQTTGVSDIWDLADALMSWRERTAAGALRDLVRDLADVLADIDGAPCAR